MLSIVVNFQFKVCQVEEKEDNTAAAFWKHASDNCEAMFLSSRLCNIYNNHEAEFKILWTSESSLSSIYKVINRHFCQEAP